MRRWISKHPVKVALSLCTIGVLFWIYQLYVKTLDPVSQLSENPNQLILYSIDGSPFRDKKLDEVRSKGIYFHGDPVLGQVEIADPNQRRAIIAAIKGAVWYPTEFGGKLCFYPRHAIRVINRFETIEMGICFECENYHSYRDGLIYSNDTSGHITASPQPLLDKTLTDAGVMLAPKDC